MHARVGGGYEPYIWLWTEQQKVALTNLKETSCVGEAVQSSVQKNIQPHPSDDHITSGL